ncbi:MAG: hypothetical protein FJY76_03095 [Candidatus Aenigmarchaeota archaeon]|nr:hypothetical protein [Candidatus Aenigmarchaeota archaeon]
MGTTTFYLRHNDFGARLGSMTKEELERMDRLSPYGNERDFRGWRVPLELHNGNVHVLIFWKGRLMRLEDAPRELSGKYYDRYSGKTRKEYEWTLLKKMMLADMDWLDREFKKAARRKRREQAAQS